MRHRAAMEPDPMMLMLLLAAGATQTAASEPASAPAKEKRICRTMEPDTGSHFGGKRVCHTKSEWASVDTANGEAARSFSDRAIRSGNASIN